MVLDQIHSSMTSRVDKSLLQGFSRLSPTATFYEPQSTGTQRGSTATISALQPLPLAQQCNLVVFCAWANANIKHIAKYTTAYQQLMPTARILVLESSMSDFIYRSVSSQRDDISPALPVIASSLDTEMSAVSADKSHGILLHILSNGGANTAVELNSLMRSQKVPPLEPRAMLIDSAPSRGDDTFDTFRTAMTSMVPANPPSLRIVVQPILVLLYAYFWIIGTLGSEIQTAKIGRIMLEDKELFPKDVPWGYVSSEADKVVLAKDVRWHSGRARQLGRVVKVDWCLEKSGHVNHVGEEGGKYWRLLAELLQ
jgi:hypothetical protein